MRRITWLLLFHLFACSNEGHQQSAPVESPTAYQGACDLSHVVAIDQGPGRVHVVVHDPDHLTSHDRDVTSIYKSLLCNVSPSRPELDLARPGGWQTISVGGVKKALRIDEVVDGDHTRLVYERRELTDKQLYIMRKEILKRTRSMTAMVSMLLPRSAGELELDKPIEQLGRENPGRYIPITYTYTFE